MSLVAIVGRPNVGKSTLINRIVGRREAIVEETAGVTRDRKYLAADWAGRSFTLIDTGGLDFGERADLGKKVREQALFAVNEADLVVFLVDGVSGPIPPDDEVAAHLRSGGRPTLLVINKLDDPSRAVERAEFYKLGLGDPLEISALHGIGVGDLLDEIVKRLPEEKEEQPAAEAFPVVIVGRPNAGKSSIFNCVVGEERTIVSELPGTTRDAIDSLVEREGERYLFVDTAGLRKKAKIKGAIEYYTSLRVRRALARARLVLLVVDAAEGVAEQDQKIASEIAERGQAAIVLLNKWDLVGSETAQSALEQAREALRFFEFAPILTVSALNGRGLEAVFPTIEKVKEQYFRRVPTAKLNEFIERNRESLSVVVKRKPMSVYYATQASVGPPTFVLFVNLKAADQLVPPSHRRFVARRIRETFDFAVAPVRIRFREKRSGHPR